VLEALAAGVNVAGYFHWSLMDNFEWAEGYRRRFGLHYVEFGSGRRLAKRSAAFYREVALTNTLVPEPALAARGRAPADSAGRSGGTELPEAPAAV
jgi:beta-glucosidase/6-phospho-beta-glucosidase/beta-galactosidase